MRGLPGPPSTVRASHLRRRRRAPRSGYRRTPISRSCSRKPAARVPPPTIVLGARGKPFTGEGFRREFFNLIRKLEAAGMVGKALTFRGLRHTVAKCLADAGCDTRDIQAWLGHATAAMAAHYAKEADQKRRVKAAVVKLDRARRRGLTR